MEGLIPGVSSQRGVINIPFSLRKFGVNLDLIPKDVRLPQGLWDALAHMNQQSLNYVEFADHLGIPATESAQLFRQLLEQGYLRDVTHCVASLANVEVDLEESFIPMVGHQPVKDEDSEYDCLLREELQGGLQSGDELEYRSSSTVIAEKVDGSDDELDTGSDNKENAKNEGISWSGSLGSDSDSSLDSEEELESISFTIG